MNLYEMARWWRKQSLPHDRGGSFDIELYLQILKNKYECLDCYITQAEASERVTTSQVKPSQTGKQESCTD